MILYSFPSSPFGCKVKAVILACEQENCITIKEFHPWQPDKFFRTLNPLGKIPTLEIGPSEALFDSSVICEYIMEKSGKTHSLMPDRIKSLKIQALTDGMAEAAVLMRYERFFRPKHLQCEDWYERQYLGLTQGLLFLEARVGIDLNYELLFENLCVVTLLSYLEFRFPDLLHTDTYKNIHSWHGEFMKNHHFLEPSKAQDHPIPFNIMSLKR